MTRWYIFAVLRLYFSEMPISLLLSFAIKIIYWCRIHFSLYYTAFILPHILFVDTFAALSSGFLYFSRAYFLHYFRDAISRQLSAPYPCRLILYCRVIGSTALFDIAGQEASPATARLSRDFSPQHIFSPLSYWLPSATHARIILFASGQIPRTAWNAFYSATANYLIYICSLVISLKAFVSFRPLTSLLYRRWIIISQRDAHQHDEYDKARAPAMLTSPNSPHWFSAATLSTS